MLPRAIPPCATTSASDKTSAATVADVRRGACSRLSAASAPSIGRSHFSGTRRIFTSTCERNGTSSSAESSASA